MREYTLVRNGKHAGEFDSLSDIEGIAVQIRRLEQVQKLPSSILGVARSRELVSEGIGRAVIGLTPTSIRLLEYCRPGEDEPMQNGDEENEE